LTLGTNPKRHFFAQVFFGIQDVIESLEPLIGLLAYLEPKLWLKKQKLVKNLSHTKGNPGHFS